MKEMYEDLKEKINSDSLKELTLRLMDAYKTQSASLLQSYGRVLFPGETIEGKALFYKLIKFFHPDRLAVIHKELEEAYQKEDRKKLLFYKKLINAEGQVKKDYRRRFDMDFNEFNNHPNEYGNDDFGYGYDLHEDEEEQVEKREFDFISAVVSELMGNQDIDLAPRDLMALDGELNLADYGIDDIDGVEYCRNISSLNLSGNNISNIFDISSLDYLRELYLEGNMIHDISPLKGLTNLEIVDLADNEIEDISPLVTLDHLKFLNISGNPLCGAKKIIKAMEQEGIIVIY